MGRDPPASGAGKLQSLPNLNMETIESNLAETGRANWLENHGGPISASANGARCARTIQPHGNAWEYFPHDHARSRAYRWGEDGIAGISDDQCSNSAFRWRCGTAKTRSSRSASLA
jgi:hypothetical protein